MEHPENSSEYAGLQVNAGVAQPSIVSPYLRQMRKKRQKLFTPAEYVEGILKGNVSMTTPYLFFYIHSISKQYMLYISYLFFNDIYFLHS